MSYTSPLSQLISTAKISCPLGMRGRKMLGLGNQAGKGLSWHMAEESLTILSQFWEHEKGGSWLFVPSLMVDRPSCHAPELETQAGCWDQVRYYPRAVCRRAQLWESHKFLYVTGSMAQRGSGLWQLHLTQSLCCGLFWRKFWAWIYRVESQRL